MAIIGRGIGGGQPLPANVVQDVTMRRIRRHGLEAELRLLMEHRDGIEGTKALTLPLLQKNSLVRTMIGRGSTLEAAVREVLLDALTDFEPQPMAEALRWEFAIAPGSGGHLPHERTATALARSTLTSDQYSHDTQHAATGKLTRESHRTRALRRLVTLLDEANGLSAVAPAIAPTIATSTSAIPSMRGCRRMRIGRLEIHDAIPIASCDKQQSSTHELLLEFEGDLRPSRPEPDEWPLLNAQLLPALEEEARKAVVKFENDPILDLVYAEHRPETAAGAQRYKIGVAESRYYHWAATANSLDRNLEGFPDLTKRLGHPKLREAWNCDPSSLGDLTRLPAPAFIGVCVVVIAEGDIILLERRPEHQVANTATAGKVPAHFMGEGMQPKDVDAGRYSPEQAARRGCYEELGIGSTHLTLVPTGLVIDTKRWQPLFCFVGKCDLTIPQLEHCMENAPHKYETGFGEIAACLPWTVQDDDTLAVLTGEDPVFSLASNHAQAALLNALYYVDGREAVHGRLSA
jgi:hypothetical protein